MTPEDFNLCCEFASQPIPIICRYLPFSALLATADRVKDDATVLAAARRWKARTAPADTPPEPRSSTL